MIFSKKVHNSVGFVYCRTNTLNGKVYIGQHSGDEKKDSRWVDCVKEAARGRGYALGAAIRKYGSHAFASEVLYYAKNQYELDRMETFFIVMYQSYLYENGYNLTRGGTGGKPTDLTREKISKALLGKNKGKKQTKEACIRKSISSKVKYSKMTLEERSRQSRRGRYACLILKKRSRLRICYMCFNSFKANSNRDFEGVFCSKKCWGTYRSYLLKNSIIANPNELHRLAA